MSSFGVKVIRTAFGLAEHVAPRLAGRVAFELFARTPDPEKMSPGEARAVERAAGFMAEARHHRIPSGRGCLAAAAGGETYPRNSDSTLFGTAFAWASIETPDCCRICARVGAAVSIAKSASRIRLREADRFSATVCRLPTADSKRFWIAPSEARA